MSTQDQFLNVIDPEVARRRFHDAFILAPLGVETVSLDAALGRVLAEDIIADVNVPAFDRSNYDGFAVRASDTFEAQEERPRTISLLAGSILPGVHPDSEVVTGMAIPIATGGMIPRGADAVVKVEDTNCADETLSVFKSVTAGFGMAHTGTDIATGEIVLRRGQSLTSRETGVLAAIGRAAIPVHRRVRVAIISTGDELISPGTEPAVAQVFDSNSVILAGAVRELGALPVRLGIAPDDTKILRDRLRRGLKEADVVLLSGGTSKGEGDLCYRVVAELNDPGIVAHGVALKPGKPLCLAVSEGKPVVVLPGFPTSAIFTFHHFVAPVIAILSGRQAAETQLVQARLAVKMLSEIGRAEFLLVQLVQAEAKSDDLPTAFPMGAGSGSVTTFSRADGFITIDRDQEIVEQRAQVSVRLLGRELQLADLVVIGSHCLGLDFLLGELESRGFRTKFIAVGSTAGLDAARRGQCDLAGIHLLDPTTGQYNRPMIDDRVELIPGYRRMQGVLFRRGDARFEGNCAADAIAAVKNDPECLMINRNLGSGTRILIDRLLGESKPPGYSAAAKNHHAVAAAVLQDRADWGIAIESVSTDKRLGFLPIGEEQYDFVVPSERTGRPAVVALKQLLSEEVIKESLRKLGLEV